MKKCVKLVISKSLAAGSTTLIMLFLIFLPLCLTVLPYSSL